MNIFIGILVFIGLFLLVWIIDGCPGVEIFNKKKQSPTVRSFHIDIHIKTNPHN